MKIVNYELTSNETVIVTMESDCEWIRIPVSEAEIRDLLQTTHD